MLPKSLLALLTASLLFGYGAAPAKAVKIASPGAACSLLGAAQASGFLGGAAHVVHETNKKGSGATVLNRGCSYSSGDELIAYTANTYAGVGLAKAIFATTKKATLASTPNLFLMGADSVMIAGSPGFARLHRLIPGDGEAPPAKEFLYMVVVRKGASILVLEYGANDLDSMPPLYTLSKKITVRM